MVQLDVGTLFKEFWGISGVILSEPHIDAFTVEFIYISSYVVPLVTSISYFVHLR